MSAPYAGMTELINGNFADAEGNPVALGYIIMQLNQDAQSSLTSQVVGGRTIKITLDASGNADTGQYVWPNTALNPNTTFYIVNVYTAAGQLVWGPNYMLVNTTPTFDLDGWVPNQVGSGGAPVGSITLQTNEVNNGSQQLLDLHAGSNITLTDNGSGRVTIDAVGGNGPRARGWRGWTTAGVAGVSPSTGYGCVPNVTLAGGAGYTAVNPTATEAPMTEVNTSASADSVTFLDWSGSNDYNSIALGNLGLLETRMALFQTTTTRCWIGLGVNFGNFYKSDTPPETTVAFRYTAGTDTYWQCVVSDGTTQVTTATTVAPDTTGHVFAISPSGTNVLFYIDGVLVATVSISTTTLTGASLFNGFFSIDNVGTANNVSAGIVYYYWDTNP